MPPEAAATGTTIFVQWLLTLGVGGALAAMMFFYYRRDSQIHVEAVERYADLWKSQSEIWMALIKENSTATAINTKTMEALHKRLDEDRLVQKLQADVTILMAKLGMPNVDAATTAAAHLQKER